MTYNFASASQLMFKVMILSGRQVQIHFSQRDANGMATFVTSDENIALGIMAHPFYLRGRIKLTSQVPTVEPAVIVSKPVVQETPADADKAETIQDPVAEAKTADIPEEGSVLEFPNITIAKDYLHRTYGVNKTEIRSMIKIMAYAESKGITIKITEAE